MDAALRMGLLLGMMVGCGVVSAQDVDALKAGVVKITAQAEGIKRTGTGFIVKLEADAVQVVTASHVVEGDPRPQLEFFVQRNNPVASEVVRLEGGDPKGLALLVLRGKIPKGLVAMALAPNASLKGGEAVDTIGFGQGQGDWAVIRANVVSLDGRDLKLAGSMGEGNSGGPVLKAGKVVGLITGMERAYPIATPSKFVEFILRNWGVDIAVVEAEPKSAASAAGEELVRSQTGALDAISKALDESVTKPIAANTANAAARAAPERAPPPAPRAAIDLNGQYVGRSLSIGANGESYVCDFVSIMTQRGTAVSGEYRNTCGDQGTFVGEVTGDVLTTRLTSALGYACNTSANVLEMGAAVNGRFDCNNGLRGTSTMSRR